MEDPEHRVMRFEEEIGYEDFFLFLDEYVFAKCNPEDEENEETCNTMIIQQRYGNIISFEMGLREIDIYAWSVYQIDQIKKPQE